MKVLETIYEYCPGCGFPTRYNKQAIGEISGIKYICDTMPDIQVHTRHKERGGESIIFYAFTCPRCDHRWIEHSDEHNLENDNE